MPSIHNLWFRRLDRVRTTNDRTFWAGLAGASLLHAALIFGASSSTPRQLGEKDGLMDGISIELVEPEALAGNTGPHEGEPTVEPASDSSAPQLPRPPANADAWQTSTAPDKPKAPSVEEKPQQQAMLSQPDPEALMAQQDQKETPKESQKEQKEPQKETTQKEPKKDSQKSATSKSPTKDTPRPPQLDFSLPSNFNLSAGGGGHSWAATRPEGITRSGENDAFGRDVIRALRKTMPGHDKIGRVTVRILLSDNGNLVDLQLLKGSGDSYLDQIVMFAARQAVYPFPPKGAPAVDRTFVVTYIYS